MTVERATDPAPWVGCCVASETGVVVVLTDHGAVRASYGAGLLCRIARDPRRRPAPGDWVELCRWPDARVTVERVRCDPPRRRLAEVVALRTPRGS